MDLFTPLELGELNLANRIVMAPMTRSRAGEGAMPTELAVEYYRQRASAGLIITEGTTVNDAVASMGESIPAFHGEKALSWMVCAGLT